MVEEEEVPHQRKRLKKLRELE
jgi:hypothetical protein